MLLELEPVLEKTYTLVVRAVNYKKEPSKNLNVKVFRLEKEPITLNQWAENLRNGTPFKRLILSKDTDNNGNVTVELPEGVYEAKVEKYGLSKVCELKQNDEILLIEPQLHWWKS